MAADTGYSSGFMPGWHELLPALSWACVSSRDGPSRADGASAGASGCVGGPPKYMKVCICAVCGGPVRQHPPLQLDPQPS